MAQTMEKKPTLASQTEECVTAFISQLPDDTKQTVGNAFEELAASDVAANAIDRGDKAPNFTLPNANGDSVELAKLTEDGPVVLSFYRGGWCPFCSLEFKALIDILPELKSCGAQLIGVSPETPDTSAETVNKHQIPFEVLSDVANVVTKDYGLLATVYEEMRPLYLQWGFDIPAFNGDGTWELPVPATYIIDRDGVVRSAFVEKDYTKRMEPADILAAVREL